MEEGRRKVFKVRQWQAQGIFIIFQDLLVFLDFHSSPRSSSSQHITTHHNTTRRFDPSNTPTPTHPPSHRFVYNTYYSTNATYLLAAVFSAIWQPLAVGCSINAVTPYRACCAGWWSHVFLGVISTTSTTTATATATTTGVY
jgi:hypothetical protein